jgi:Uncharacterised nucleotidyltransferase
MKMPTKTPGAIAWLPAIRDPARVLGWTLPEWEQVIRLSRRLRLLARLAEGVNSAGLLGSIPTVAARHLDAELRFSRWRTGALRWTIDRIGAHFGVVAFPLVLLKGAAYIAQDLLIAHGRLPSDVDILVPRHHIADAQALLVHAGWFETQLDSHDRRYYYEWSHEVPPMRHAQFGLELDLHHNILPPVGRRQVDADLLLARLQPAAWPGWHVLAPVDQVLHSAAHLFYDAEVGDRLRDLVDLDGLFRHFGSSPAFWSELVDRARQLGLGECLALACHFTSIWLQTPIPTEAHEEVMALGPSPLRRAALNYLFDAALLPADPDGEACSAQSLAARTLLVRHHLSRLPMPLLVNHTWHKLVASTRRAATSEATSERR